jgi:hypothetical protein
MSHEIFICPAPDLGDLDLRPLPFSGFSIKPFIISLKIVVPILEKRIDIVCATDFRSVLSAPDSFSRVASAPGALLYYSGRETTDSVTVLHVSSVHL